MHVSIFKEGGYSQGGFTSAGETLTGPLYLANDPLLPLEASTKQYVDVSISLHINNNSTHLASTEKLLISNLTVSSIEINRLSGVISDVQIQLNSKMSLSGGSFSGFITANANPTSALHVATKQYIDTAISNAGAGLSIGDIVRKTVSTTPLGFLRCNGAQVSKTTYSALYAVIGDTFSSSSLTSGNGQPWKQQYDINTTQSTDITGWATGTSLPGTVAYSQAIVTKNRVYLLGGFFGSSANSAVYTATINADGTLGTWTTGTSLPATVYQSQAIVTKNRVYLLGGWDDNIGRISIVYTAPINTDGTLGTWTTGISLPEAVMNSQAIVTKNRVYLLGGVGNMNVNISTVRTAPINTDGTLGTWTTGTPLPGTVTHSQAIVTKNRVYLLGGNINGGSSSVTYTAPINIDGTLGTWTTGTSLPDVTVLSQAIVTKNRVYLFGAHYSSAVWTAPINTDGTIGTWTTGTSLPVTVYNSQAIVTKNKVYILGGDGKSTVYTAPISGGLNDYSPYYDGTIVPTDPANFNVPDYNLSDVSLPSSYSYIKY
ncbi:MAG: hypothetical protein ACD_33C00030G0004 [uncultured bacterium]|nr:MAG: hypothetical protein ACD_33C00030G0004 [uncultured bacterium]